MWQLGKSLVIKEQVTIFDDHSNQGNLKQGFFNYWRKVGTDMILHNKALYCAKSTEYHKVACLLSK